MVVARFASRLLECPRVSQVDGEIPEDKIARTRVTGNLSSKGCLPDIRFKWGDLSVTQDTRGADIRCGPAELFGLFAITGCSHLWWLRSRTPWSNSTQALDLHKWAGPARDLLNLGNKIPGEAAKLQVQFDSPTLPNFQQLDRISPWDGEAESSRIKHSANRQTEFSIC